MTFNNSSNKVRVIGFIVSDIKNLSAYAIEFLIAVPRKVKKGEQCVHCICQRGKHDLLCKKSFAQRLCSSCKGRTEDLYGQISEDMQQ